MHCLLLDSPFFIKVGTTSSKRDQYLHMGVAEGAGWCPLHRSPSQCVSKSVLRIYLIFSGTFLWTTCGKLSMVSLLEGHLLLVKICCPEKPELGRCPHPSICCRGLMSPGVCLQLGAPSLSDHPAHSLLSSPISHLWALNFFFLPPSFELQSTKQTPYSTQVAPNIDFHNLLFSPEAVSGPV